MLEDVRRYIEAAIGNLTPARAQELAKQLLEPGARKEQVSKAAQELIDWSQRNRQRLKEFVDREVKDQIRKTGVATQSELDALKKRVRELERSAGKTASSRKRTTRSATKRTTSRSPAKGSSSEAATGESGPEGNKD